MVSVIYSGCLDNFTFLSVQFKIDVRCAKPMLGSSKVSTSDILEESNIELFKTSICQIFDTLLSKLH